MAESASKVGKSGSTSQCEKGCDFGVPTGPRMAPELYSAAGTGNGISVLGAHGGPLPTATAGAAQGRGQSL